jgi:1-acyl-sn-glycerol-3-phosphate acyltransferase
VVEQSSSPQGKPERVFRVFETPQERFTAGRRFVRDVALPVACVALRVRVIIHEMERYLPKDAPAIVIMNHSGGIDPLIMMKTIRPRFLQTMTKIENYDLPIFNTFMRLWGAYPVTRGEVDRRALDFTLQLLRQGELVLIAPEGTRQPTMIEAKDGLAYLAVKAGVPIVPVGLEGTRTFFSNLKRLRRTDVNVRFGQPFRLKTGGKSRVSRETLGTMTRETMYQLAKLVPESQRGVYTDLSQATTEFLEFIE